MAAKITLEAGFIVSSGKHLAFGWLEAALFAAGISDKVQYSKNFNTTELA